MFANVGDTCYCFKSILGKVLRSEEPRLFCTHEEADSRMFFHAASVPPPATIVIRTSDTDCLVIAVGCRSKIDSSVKLWLEAGLHTKNTLRYVSEDQLCENLGESLCNALPAYHAFTGSDYTAAFCRKGKVRPFKKLEKDERLNWHLLDWEARTWLV